MTFPPVLRTGNGTGCVVRQREVLQSLPSRLTLTRATCGPQHRKSPPQNEKHSITYGHISICSRLIRRQGLHDVLFGTVIQNAHPHFFTARDRKFCDADRVKLRAEPFFRVYAQVIGFCGTLFLLGHTITPFQYAQNRRPYPINPCHVCHENAAQGRAECIFLQMLFVLAASVPHSARDTSALRRSRRSSPYTAKAAPGRRKP